MKNILCLFSALTLVLISSCSSDDSSSVSKENLVLPKTISMTFPRFPSDNTKETITYNGNKIVMLVDEDSKTLFTYDGNVITKQVQFDVDDKGNEVKSTEVSYTYDRGKLIERNLREGFSANFPNGQYIYKTVYTHVSDNQITYVHYFVDPKTKVETKEHQGVLNYKDGNLIKGAYITTSYTHISTFEYDTKNNPLKNILGFKLLLDEIAECGNNNVLKMTEADDQSTFSYFYLSSYIYNDNGFPMKLTSYTSDGKTIEYETEYTY